MTRESSKPRFDPAAWAHRLAALPWRWREVIDHWGRPQHYCECSPGHELSKTGGFPLREMHVRFGKRRLGILMRDGTIDPDLVQMILRDAGEYTLPEGVEPRVVFDIGANIGTASLFFALRYPKAQVYAFEPLPENYEMLRLNVARNDIANVHTIPCGLSDRTATMEYHYSADRRNFGGGGFHASGTDPARHVPVEVTTAAKIIADLALTRVDVFKIDTEGHEMPILRGIPETIRRQAQAFIGELHGECDWEFCETLAPTHAVGVQKRYNAPCFPFVAVRKDLVVRKPAVRKAA